MTALKLLKILFLLTLCEMSGNILGKMCNSVKEVINYQSHIFFPTSTYHYQYEWGGCTRQPMHCNHFLI
jgi:hypothetical protein